MSHLYKDKKNRKTLLNRKVVIEIRTLDKFRDKHIKEESVGGNAK